MKTRLIIFFLLLFVLGLDGMVLAKEASNYPAFKPDGVNAIRPQRRKRGKRKSQRKARTYAIEAPNDAAGAPAPAPPPPPSPSAEPTMAAPAVEAMPGADAPPSNKSSSPKKSAPGIKPPTVMIKPPTE
jgi:hypothetical protein